MSYLIDIKLLIFCDQDKLTLSLSVYVYCRKLSLSLVEGMEKEGNEEKDNGN